MRAATSPELTKLRSDGQWSRLYLAFADQTIVFQARVNATFTTTDQVKTVAFDTVTLGAYTDLKEGMTLYVGSAAGLSDIGQARIKSATSTVITIGRTSDVLWTDNLYLTAVRDFSLWAKQPLLDANGQKLDDDLEYTDQLLKMRPVPIMGPDALLRLSAGTVSYHPSAEPSWVPGSTISGYSWSVTPSSGVTITSETTATPTITITAVGTYDIQLTVTAANGTTTTGHRTLRVVGGAETPITEFTLDQLQADMNAGGWNATITMLAQADQSSVRDRAKVFIYSDDYYAGALGSVGQQAELEHQIFVGWIQGETIEYDAIYGTVSFEVKGPGFWLTQLGSTATYIEPVTGTPANWNQMTTTTLKEIIWYFAIWRSTAAQVIDVLVPTVTTPFGGITAGMGTIWSQMTDAASNRLLCEPRCDRYGRLSFDRDPQIMTSAERSALPVLMAMTKDDSQEKIQFDRKLTPDTGVIELSGLYFTSGALTPALILSRASGWAMKRYGKPETRDRIVAVDQDDANRIAGCLLGKANNPYPRVTMTLAQNNRMIDIAPASYCTLTLGAGETPRGVSWTDKRLIPRKITQSWKPGTGEPTTTVEFEPESTQEVAVAVDAPTIGKINVPGQPDPDFPPLNPFTSPYQTNPPPVVVPDLPPITPKGCPSDAPANGPFHLFVSKVLYDNTTESCFIYFGRFTFRGSGAANQSTLVLNVEFDEWVLDHWEANDTATWADAYLLDMNGTRVWPGAWSGSGPLRTIIFAPPANTLASGIEIVIHDPNVLAVASITSDSSQSGRFGGGGAARTISTDNFSWSDADGTISARLELKVVYPDNANGGFGFLMSALNEMNVVTSPGLSSGDHLLHVEAVMNRVSGTPDNMYFYSYNGIGCEFVNYAGADHLATAFRYVTDDAMALAQSDGVTPIAVRDLIMTVHANGTSEQGFRLVSMLFLHNPSPYAGQTAWFTISWTVRNPPTRRLVISHSTLYNVCH